MTLDNGLVVGIRQKQGHGVDSKPEVTFGTYLDKTHFSLFLSKDYVKKQFEGVSYPDSLSRSTNICVLWDTSFSCKPKEGTVATFFNALRESYSEKREDVNITLYAFSTSLEKLGENLSVDEVIRKISETPYDGGTNLATLGSVFLSQLKEETAFDAFILYTDGVDNIGDGTRVPGGITEDFAKPVHVLVPGSETINQNLLQCITTVTKSHYGSLDAESARVIANSEDIFAVTYVMPTMTSGPQSTSEHSLLELFQDEDFSIVPDWRLGDRSWWPLKKNGVLITGVLPQSARMNSDAFEITLSSNLRGKKTLTVPITDGPSKEIPVNEGEVGRLIGLSHCLNMIEESRAIQTDPEISRNYIEKIAREYNTASDYTTLLLLHSAIQFYDNGIDCPADHPGFAEWKEIKAKQETTEEIKKLRKEVQRLNKLKSIQHLAQNLVTYYTDATPTTPEERRKELSEFKLEIAGDLKQTIRSLISSQQQEVDGIRRELLSRFQDLDDEHTGIGQQFLRMTEALQEKYDTLRPLIYPSRYAEFDCLYDRENVRMRNVDTAYKANGFQEYKEGPEVQDAESAITRIRERLEEICTKYEEQLAKEEAKYRKEIEDWETEQREKLSAVQKHHSDAVVAGEKKLEEVTAHLKKLEEAEKLKEEAEQTILRRGEANKLANDDRLCARDDYATRDAMRCYRNCNRHACCDRACANLLRDGCMALKREVVKDGEYYFYQFVSFIEDFANQVTQLEGQTTRFAEKFEEFKRWLERALQTVSEYPVKVESSCEKIIQGFDAQVAEKVTEKRNNQLAATQVERQQVETAQTRRNKIETAAQHQAYLKPISDVLLQSESESSISEAYSVYLKERDANSNQASFFIYAARLFHEAECDKSLSTRIITNTLELNLQDIQMFRSVAYFMFEIGATEEAIALFRRVQDKAPAEPHSFMDLGMALYFDARKRYKNNEISVEVLGKQIREAIQNLATVLTRTWPHRFTEIEWPVLVWINWMVGFGEHVGLGDLWPVQVEEFCRVPGISFDLIVALGWDTDYTDIDLHVQEPSSFGGEKVCFWNHHSKNGGHFSRDFRQGYGPECYLVKRALPGFYDINVNYFCSFQDSAATGATSCVIWRVKWLGHFDVEEMDFRMVRLTENAYSAHVMSIDMVF